MRLEFVRTYDEAIDEVLSALTSPERVARWLGTVSGGPTTGRVEVVMTEDEGATPNTVTIWSASRPAGSPTASGACPPCCGPWTT